MRAICEASWSVGVGREVSVGRESEDVRSGVCVKSASS